MLKSLALVSLLATAAAANAQSPDATDQAPAPIVRSYQANPVQQTDPARQNNQPRPGLYRNPMPRRGRRLEQPPDQILDSQPIAGVWLRSRSTGMLKTISATPRGTEVRLERGILNVNVHQPAVHSEILIDLPGGQVSLLKDGLYTFNADTNTVRVLHGEAAAYSNPIGATAGVPVSGPNKKAEKPVKIKESHQLAFAPVLPASAAPGSASAPTLAGAGPLKSVEAYPYELTADLLPAMQGDGDNYANFTGEDGPYYGGYNLYPGYSYGPWGYGYPFSYGIGIGYYGGFGGYRGGGFRR